MVEKKAPRSFEREFETMADEFFKFASMLAALNGERTYDEYLALSLDHTRAIQNLSTQVLQDAISVGKRVMNNAATADHIATMRALDHGDAAFDATWVPGPGEEGIEMPGDKDE